MGSILGLDYGARRVGVALSDDDQRVAVAVTTLSAAPERALLASLRQLLQERAVERIVLGLPLSMAGSDTPQTITVRQFADRLQTLGVPVTLYDERLSSVAADRVGKATGASRDERAAVIMLQAYLDRQHNEKTL